MAAPKARPAPLKLIEGRGNGRDSGGRKVPKPPAFRRLPPKPPAWLSREALAEWKRVLPELQRLGITKELDAAALTAYCETWELFKQARDEVAESGITIVNRGSNGAEQYAPNPAVGTMLKASQQLRAWCAEFGLTPSAEMKLGKNEDPDGPEDSPFG